MATIRREIYVEARPETAWDALRDLGALHTRLVPGFVVDTRLQEAERIVTFGNGLVARERIVSVEQDARRVVWSVVGGAMTHHNGAAQVLADGTGCRFTWTADLLPDTVAPNVAAMMDQAMPIIRSTLEQTQRSLER
jgi:carbon monoxide dehydrogenase subunit G